ncbi:MAG: DUF1858 domain-containing protein [candidate division Zixibacteria bacterium]|nr:DUF1858 domain-containing protein [candidate division Zixibacteria bacterium]
MMNKNDINKAEYDITPDTKIGELLSRYPDLENVLLEISPAFAKLKNPILRKTVAKVANLRQAAQIGGITVAKLINQLREAAGLADDSDVVYEPQSSQTSEPPEWVRTSAVIKTLDASEMLEKGEHPVTIVLSEIKNLQEKQLYLLITPFIPAPLIDKARNQGFLVWYHEADNDKVKTYFHKS